jgi:hypothetical protein
MDPFPVLGFRFILTEKKVKSKGNRTCAVPLKGLPRLQSTFPQKRTAARA